MYTNDYNQHFENRPETPATDSNGWLIPQQPVYPTPYTQDFGQPTPPPPGPPKKKRRGVWLGLAAALLVALSGTAGIAVGMQAAPLASASDAGVSKTGTSTTPSPSPVVASENGGSGSVIDVVNKAADSVVEITTEVRQYHPFYGNFVSQGAGSGVILTSDGYIVTNYHVIEDATAILVRLRDGTEYSARLVGTDEANDLAVLKVEAAGLTAATFADSDNIQVGQLAVAIGNPLGELGGSVTEGIISALGREIKIDNKTMTLLQTSAAINPGNSGGGLFDSNGNLVGIVNAKSSGEEIEGLGFAIPSNTVYESVTQMLEADRG